MIDTGFKGIVKLFAGLAIAPVVIKSSNTFSGKTRDNNYHIEVVCNDIVDIVYGNQNSTQSLITNSFENNV